MAKIFLTLVMLANSLYVFSQETILVKFSVDASMLQSVKNFGVRGNTGPLNWDNTYLLQDPEKDGIFEGELLFPKDNNAVVEYKFVYGAKNPVYELEGQNRILILDSKLVELNLVWDTQQDVDIEKLPELSGEKLLADFVILEKALVEIHPGLYRYKTRNEIDAVFSHYRTLFSQPMTYRDAYLNFTRLTASIQCGHTFPGFYNQNGFIQEIVLNQKDKLPFTFRVIDGRMIITENVADGIELPAGTEVLAINEVSTATLLRETASLVKADGVNDAKRYADLNTFGIGAFEMFDAYFPLLYPPADMQYTLKIQKPDAKEEEVTVRTMDRAERRSRLKQKNSTYPVTADEQWQLAFWDNNTAYLQLGTFDGFQLTLDWKQFLKNAFKEIKKRKIENLVIDIRWNEGGQDDILLYLGQNIAKYPIKIPERIDLVGYSKISEELKPYLFTWDDAYYDLSQKVAPYDDAYYAFSRQDVIEVKPTANVFEGKLYLLVNAANSSATFYFAEIVKENKLATLVGETTGGSQKGLNAGSMFFLRLPHSGIEVDIPIVGTFSEDKPAGGIVPDVAVAETVEDITKGEDKVILQTKRLILEN